MAQSTRIALISGASPRKCVAGPTVRLPVGKWRLNVHGKVDSCIVLHIGSTSIGEIHDGNECVVKDNPDHGVRIVFTKAGSEEWITIVADRVA